MPTVAVETRGKRPRRCLLGAYTRPAEASAATPERELLEPALEEATHESTGERTWTKICSTRSRVTRLARLDVHDRMSGGCRPPIGYDNCTVIQSDQLPIDVGPTRS